MKKYLARYHANPPDYEATIKKAQALGIKVEIGGGRKTKAGESPNAQIILNLKDIYSKIENNRGGRILIYYTSKPNLDKCVQLLKQCYVPNNGKLDWRCKGPTDPLDRAFEFTTTINWMGTEMRCAEAKVNVYQWLDPKTGEYIFCLPDRENRIVSPGIEYIYQGCVPIRIIAIDKDDAKGNRVVTAERLVWQGVEELKRIVLEHPRLKLLRY